MSQPKKPRLTGGDRIVAWTLMVMVALTIALVVLNALNLRLVAGELYLFLPMMVLLLLIGWGGSALWRRMRPGTVRKVVGAVLIAAMALVVMLALSFTTMFAGINVPRKYITLTNEGHSLVVLRALDSDQTRIDARYAARREADPESNPEMTAEDWGYTYTAYKPALLGLFYKPDTQDRKSTRLNSSH